MHGPENLLADLLVRWSNIAEAFHNLSCNQARLYAESKIMIDFLCPLDKVGTIGWMLRMVKKSSIFLLNLYFHGT